MVAATIIRTHAALDAPNPPMTQETPPFRPQARNRIAIGIPIGSRRYRISSLGPAMNSIAASWYSLYFDSSDESISVPKSIVIMT